VGGQALVGDRYGYRPFPACIDSAEFETLMSVKGLAVGDVDVVKEWYRPDDNSIPPSYLLQVCVKISSYNVRIVCVSVCLSSPSCAFVVH